MSAIAYFISFRGYGTWLHGRADSVDSAHNQPGTPMLAPNPIQLEAERAGLRHEPIEFDAEQRFVIDATVREVCEHRRWRLHALNVRTTHIHVIVTAAHTPERVMNDFKAYCTRRMREAGVLPREIEPWSYHGSTRYLTTPDSFERAIRYVSHEQGAVLEMRCPAGWRRGRVPGV